MSVDVARSLSDFGSLLPELLLAGGAVLILLADALLPRLGRLWIPLAALLVIATSGVLWRGGELVSVTFQGMLEWTPITSFLGQVVLLGGLVALLASQGYLRRESLASGEYTALLLWCMVGLLLLVRATELITLFLALELFSFCLYALAGYHRRLAMSLEAGIKYFLMGAFVSSFVLLGIALLYGQTGSTRLTLIAQGATTGGASAVVLTLGFLLLVCGFAFKMSVVPFHAWAPDTYQGAPSPFVAFLSVAPKAASAWVLYRVLAAVGLAELGGKWPQLLALLAVLSMVVGNVLALVQKDLKRMLAYSGIAHMGYLLIPFVSPGEEAVPPVLVYVLAYTLMNAGAFAVVALLFTRAGEQHLIAGLSGWGYRFPVIGVCLTVCMLSLGGIPPTLGFLGKYLVFAHALQHGNLGLALVGIATSLVAVFYYLRVVYVLYMKPEAEEPLGVLLDVWGRTAVVLAAAATLLLGIWPGRLFAWVERAASLL